MNKATIGALAMVLVGSVTFSFANALLTNHSTKKRVQSHVTTNFENQKLADGTNQTDKTVTDSTPTTNGKDIQIADFLHTSSNQGELNNGNMSEQPIAVNQNNTVKISSPSPSSNATASTITTTPKTNTTSTGTTSPKPTASSVPTTAPTSSTSNVPVTTTAQASSTTTTSTTNRGQQVAQAAKEKAVGQQNKKITN
jgi:hypothetical protein